MTFMESMARDRNSSIFISPNAHVCSLMWVSVRRQIQFFRLALFSLRRHRPEALPAEQAVHLLAPQVFDDCFVGDSRDALKIGRGKTDPEAAAFDQVRFFEQSPEALQEHE